MPIPVETRKKMLAAVDRGESVAAETFDGLVHAAGDALRRVGLDKCANYFTSCGHRT